MYLGLDLLDLNIHIHEVLIDLLNGLVRVYLLILNSCLVSALSLLFGLNYISP